MISSASSISTDFITQVGSRALNTRETALRTAMEQAQGDAVSTVDMLNLQQQLQQWSLLVQIISTVFKDSTDAMKAVVQKAS
jgi:type III secretion protein F